MTFISSAASSAALDAGALPDAAAVDAGIPTPDAGPDPGCVATAVDAGPLSQSSNGLPAPSGGGPWLNVVAAAPYGDEAGQVLGMVENVDVANHGVAVCIKVDGAWYSKPTGALTPLQGDGSFTADITTRPNDARATEVAVFLVALANPPPLLDGTSNTLSVGAVALASVEIPRLASLHALEFAGFTWWVKASNGLVGPGPNRFSACPDSVWVDGNGQLHLALRRRGNDYYSAEVATVPRFGYGTFRFYTASQVDQLDPNVVAGLFTWDPDALPPRSRELDVEFSTWGQMAGSQRAIFGGAGIAHERHKHSHFSAKPGKRILLHARHSLDRNRGGF